MSLAELLEALELYQGCWSVETEKGIYVFPQEITREEAVEALTRAYELNLTKHN